MLYKNLAITLCLFALSQGTTLSQEQLPDKIAILQPVYNTQNKPAGSTSSVDAKGVSLGDAVVIDGTVVNDPNAVTTPNENANRVIPKLANEAKTKFKWPMLIEDYDKTCAVEDAVLGTQGSMQKTLRFRQYKDIANKLGVRYVASYVIQELVGYYTASKGLSKRTTGRCQLELIVYDASSNEFVWQANTIDTSTVRGNHSKSDRIDQCLYNALRKTLEPFIVKGERKQITQQTNALLVTVKQVTADNKKVVIDLGEKSDIRIGDEFVSLDEKMKLRIIQVMQNGSIAEVISGNPVAGDIFNSIN